MSVLLWGNKSARFKVHLERVLKQIGSDGMVVVAGDAKELRSRVLDDRAGAEIVVLSPESADALAEVLDLRALLSELSVIILLPHDSIELVNLAHSFLPRYASSIDVSPEDLGSVVVNLLRSRGGHRARRHFRSKSERRME